MGYLRAIIQYLGTEKTRYDIFDYLRAIMIMAAVMAAIRVGAGILQ